MHGWSWPASRLRQEGDQERGDDRLVPLGADRALSPRHVDMALGGLELARSLDALQVAAGQYTTVRLPDDRSMGFLNIRDRRGDPSNEGWDYLGEARGTITVPALKELGLWVLIVPDPAGDVYPVSTPPPSAWVPTGFWSVSSWEPTEGDLDSVARRCDGVQILPGLVLG